MSLLAVIVIFAGTPIKSFATTQRDGKDLFNQYCAGCHLNGGNVIRRNRTLKISALKQRGLDNPEAIAKIAKEGIGSMSGYDDYLEEDEIPLVANWVWNQAQNAWTQG